MTDPQLPISAREARLFAQVPANRDRFLAAIAERISPDRMQAVYLFPPIKQGAVETGVAVIAVDPIAPVVEPELGLFEADAVGVDAVDAEREAALVADVDADDDADAEDDTADDALLAAAFDADEFGEALADDAPVIDGEIIAPPPRLRPVVLTARYRHTLKGPDRGRWLVEILEQADAPLATVEMVVAGVTQRRDEATEPERLDADAVRAAVAAGPWTAPTR